MGLNQLPDPSPHRLFRDVFFPGDVDIGFAAILLKMRNDAPVEVGQL